MTDNNEEAGSPAPPSIETLVPPKRSLLRRLGCGIALALWFSLLLTPCALVYLATQGEITIAQGELPGQAIRIWMIQEARQQGVGAASTSLYQPEGSDALCVQTDTRFLLWRGSEPSISYCECYRRDPSGGEWAWIGSLPEACSLAVLTLEGVMP